MITLLSTLVSFLAGGLPRLLDFFQDKSDKKHEIQLAQMQIERELALKKANLEIEQKIEEIKTDQLQINADVQLVQAAVAEKQALLAHDIALGQGASQWVINLRASTRSAITYGMFLMFAFVEIFGFAYAFWTGVQFTVAMDNLWDDEAQTILASIVSFWFGSQAFAKK
jgi:hypothetical protein